MLDASLLHRLPLDWQQKIHSEFQSKLGLCIENPEEARKAADFTWQLLLGGIQSRDWLCQQFEPLLKQYAGDFADWLLEFIGQAIKHFQSLDSLFVSSAPNASASDTGIQSATPISQNNIQATSVNVAATQQATANAVENPFSAPSQIGVQVQGGGGTTFGGFGSGGFGNTNQGGHGSFFGADARGAGFGPQDQGEPRRGGFGSTNMSQRGGNNALSMQGTVDPLDQSLDALIMKQKMQRMQGLSDAPLGVMTRSTKFKPQNRNDESNGEQSFGDASSPPPYQQNSPTMQPHSPFGKSAHPGRPNPQKVIKVSKLCANFPNCEYGDSCRYIHPSNTMCKHWPKCAFGPKCAYKHPHVPCRFNKSCTNPTCNYEHTA
ncbi:hypothetical protein BgAZ_302900 [Babesia gibsoni]|uniref:C3H1-type domain-containing protein n=1 Tax=Babesia gibsoni TaxID=33632 RepID=A0AAD8PDU9_BABGI|nr:hypothetical protein BgAZ_302900 [Babesia gibsoni]